jgi:hypothetical protein
MENQSQYKQMHDYIIFQTFAPLPRLYAPSKNF